MPKPTTPKACPFCGATGTAWDYQNAGRKQWMAGCQNAECSVKPSVGGFNKQDDAVSRWNFRNDDLMGEAVEACRELVAWDEQNQCAFCHQKVKWRFGHSLDCPMTKAYNLVGKQIKAGQSQTPSAPSTEDTAETPDQN